MLNSTTTGIALLALSVIPAAAQSQNYILQTVAGHTLAVEGGPATLNFLRTPNGVVSDSLGNVYIADTVENRVWKVDTSGSMTTFAGNGVAYFTGDGGPAAAAYLNSPTRLAIDGANNLYITDLGNNSIRKVTPLGIISTVAGSGSPLSSGDGGQAAKAGMSPTAVTSDKAGNLYIADGSRVRKVSAATQIISAFAGNGQQGDTGDGGQATSAALNNISGIAVDPAGNVYIGDETDCVIRKVNTANVITTPFGNKSCTTSGDGGLASAAGLEPNWLALDASASFLDFGDAGANVIRRIDLTTGRISTIAGQPGVYAFTGDGGPASAAAFNAVAQIFLDSAGNLFLSDDSNHRVRKISASNGAIDTIAGSGVDDGPAAGAYLNHPVGIAFDSQGRLGIADSVNSLVRQFSPADGTVSTLSSILVPWAMAADTAGNLYVNSDHWKVYKVSPAGVFTAIAGNGNYGYSGDNAPAINAMITNVSGIAVDAAGNVYIADYGNSLIRKIDTLGNITKVAGNGKAAYSGDGGPATSAGLDPFDIALDKSGNLYVADSANQRIRKISPAGTISTIVGKGTPAYTGDGGPAAQAQLAYPSGVTLDSAGNLYICDGNGTLREVTADGNIHTIAGNGTNYPFSGDGPARLQNLDATRATMDASGTIYLSDYSNDRIRKLVAVAPASLAIVSGNNQTSATGTTLPRNLTVKVTGSDGTPYAGATVAFSAANNTATFNPPSAVSASDGTASTTVTLGSAAGPVTVIATVTGVAAVSFSFTATAAGGVNPQIFSGGVVSAGLSAPAIQIASPNAILSIFGQNFAPAGTSRKVSGGDLVNGLVPTNLVGVCVLFGNQRAPMFLVTPGQLNLQAPQLNLQAPGTVTVQVIANCDTAGQSASNIVTLAVQPSAPEFFYAASSASGKNPVAATDGVTLAGVGDPARLGAGFALGYPREVVVIYATGLGLSTPPNGPGQLPPSAAPVSGVTVSIDGAPLDPSAIQYVGVTPLLAGVYQLNLQLPAGLNAGDHAITLSVNGVSSPPGAYISTGPPPM